MSKQPTLSELRTLLRRNTAVLPEGTQLTGKGATKKSLYKLANDLGLLRSTEDTENTTTAPEGEISSTRALDPSVPSSTESAPSAAAASIISESTPSASPAFITIESTPSTAITESRPSAMIMTEPLLLRESIELFAPSTVNTTQSTASTTDLAAPVERSLLSDATVTATQNRTSNSRGWIVYDGYESSCEVSVPIVEKEVAVSTVCAVTSSAASCTLLLSPPLNQAPPLAISRNVAFLSRFDHPHIGRVASICVSSNVRPTGARSPATRSSVPAGSPNLTRSSVPAGSPTNSSVPTGVKFTENYQPVAPKENPKRLFYQILTALSCLHSRRVVCGLLSPNSIAVSKSATRTDAAIIDLSFAVYGRGKYDIHDIHKIHKNNAVWASPEMRADLPVDEKSDMWSCGLLAAFLYTGVKPEQLFGIQQRLGVQHEVGVLQHREARELHQLIQEMRKVDGGEKLRQSIRTKLSGHLTKPVTAADSDAAALIATLLDLDATRRPTAYATLRDSYFNDVRDVDLEFPRLEAVQALQLRDRTPQEFRRDMLELLLQQNKIYGLQCPFYCIELALHLLPSADVDVAPTAAGVPPTSRSTPIDRSKAVGMVTLHSVRAAEAARAALLLARSMFGLDTTLNHNPVPGIHTLSLTAFQLAAQHKFDLVVTTASVYRMQLISKPDETTPTNQGAPFVASREEGAAFARFGAWLLLAYAHPTFWRVPQFELYLMCDELSRHVSPPTVSPPTVSPPTVSPPTVSLASAQSGPRNTAQQLVDTFWKLSPNSEIAALVRFSLGNLMKEWKGL